MNKNEYMEQLSKALETLDEEMAADILEDYEAHFARAMETGRTEEEIIEELGSIDEFVEELKQFTSDSAGKESAKGQAAKEQAGGGEAAQEEDRRSQYTHTGDYRYNKSARDDNAAGDDNAGNATRDDDAAGGNRDGDYSSFGEALDKTLKEAFKAVEASTEQLRKCFDKASWKFGEWFERHEQSSEREEDYRARQERARRERERAQRERGQERQREADWERERARRTREQESQERQARREAERAWRESERARRESERARRESERVRRESEHVQGTRGQGGEAGRGGKVHVMGAYSYISPEGPGEEAYMPSCCGSLRREEQVSRISVNGEIADIRITASPDEEMHYNYRNEGSEGSKSVYCLKKDISNGTLYLTICKNIQIQQKKNHFGILGGIFAESAELSLELQLPDWIECLEVKGSSGEIQMEDCGVRELYIKNSSGDITVERIKVRISEIKSVSGDMNIQDICLMPEGEGREEISVSLGSTSGDIDVSDISLGAGSLGLCSVSGELQLKSCDAGSLTMSSTSGDIEAQEINVAGMIQIHSVSGDMQLGNMAAEKAEAESKSGDIEIQDCNMDSACVNTISGSLNVTALSTDFLEITGVSSDVEMDKVQAGEIQVSVGSGDVNVSGLDAEKIRITSNASGDLSVSGSANVYALKSLSGDISLEQEGNTDARLESISGDINATLKNNGEGFYAKLNTRGDISINYDSLSLSEAGCGEHHYGLEGSSLEIKSGSGDITIND